MPNKCEPLFMAPKCEEQESQSSFPTREDTDRQLEMYRQISMYNCMQKTETGWFGREYSATDLD